MSYLLRFSGCLTVAVAFACLSLPCLPALAQEEDATEQFNAAMEQGQQQLTDKQFEEAAESFSEAIRLSGGASGPAYIGRATALKELEEYGRAQEDIKNVRQYYSGQDPALKAAADNLNAEIYMDLGAYGDALADLEEAVQAAPKNPLYQFNLGKAYVTLGGPDQGKKALTKWLEAGIDDTEKNAEAYRLRAQAAAQLGKYDDAKSDIADAVALEPDNHEVYALKGTLLGIQKEHQEAADAFKTALEKYTPEEDSDLPFAQAHLERALNLEEAAKLLEEGSADQLALYEEERAEVQRLLDALPDRPELDNIKAGGLFRLGVAQRYLGDLTGAVKSFSEAIDLNPMMAPAYFRRGICYFHMGEERLAIRDFDQSAALDFESPHAALWKGRTYAQLGEYYEALKAYAQALAVSDRYTDAYVNRGLTYVQMGELERAVDDFNDAIRLQPTKADHYYYRGVVYALQGEHKKAIKSLAKAIDLDDQLAGAYSRLADELDAIGKSGLASEYRSRGNQLSNQVKK